MSSPLVAASPAFLLFGLALAVQFLSRRTGASVGVLGGIATCVWVAAAPAGTHLQTSLFGFDAVLFAVDPYSRLLGMTFGFVAAVATAYAYATGADRRQRGLVLAYVGSGTGAALVGDWLSLVVFWELMAVCATVLVWHRTGDRRVGFRYAVYHELGALALVGGVLLHYVATGTFLYGGGIATGIPAVLVGLGIGLNAGFLGLHVWLVDTYPRTHVATSVVLAAITTKVGAYTLIRAFPEGNLVVAHVGGAMVLFGVTFAILQSDMRRLLSYHIVSQVGYMVAGFGAGTNLARAGAMGHLVNNVLYKSLLFMVAGLLIVRTGNSSLKKVGGLGRTMPVTAVVFAVAALSIAGVPGFNGFVSKGMILDGTEKGSLEVLWYALLVGGVGTVVSFAKFGYYAFVRETPARGHEDLRPVELLTLGTVAALCVILGLVPSLLFDLLPAEDVRTAKPFVSKQFLKAGAVTLVGLVLFQLLKEWLSHVPPVPDLDVVYESLGRRLRDRSVTVAITAESSVDRVGGVLSNALSAGLSGDGAGEVAARARSEAGGIGTGVLVIALVLVLLFTMIFV
ncbi:proton-conducting transporter transmembrane domain-containing protein [Haloarchaeobius sp. TZWWS8]|uniref:proton-conducting transporter transmembrane domain-containing protein n=1 Tax=Haloarchaeobius sp. TZWWS8 TaxID=3446121 RepID=UPI003EBBCF48